MGKAIITGASSGIGAMYADRLSAAGYDVLLVARNRQRLEGVAGALREARDVCVETLVADLSDPEQVDRVEARIEGDKDVSMLVNNAGISNGSKFTESRVDQINAILAVNVLAPTRLAAAAARRFASQGGGTIINVSSVTALLPEAFEAIYAATKAYLLTLSQAIAAETMAANVRIQAVLPGITRTEIWERSGRSLEQFPADSVMDVDDMVDSALAGLRIGETVTIPSLEDREAWETFNSTRLALRPNLSRNRPATRYRDGDHERPGQASKPSL